MSTKNNKNYKNLTINGVKYKFDVTKAINDGYLKPDRVRNIGQIYHYGENYMLLCQCDHNEVALIDLDDGNRWTFPVEVKDPYDISDDEWTEITGGVTSVEWAADRFGDLFVQR
jgi:hypothetical protein